jgi:hypothetical protein
MKAQRRLLLASLLAAWVGMILACAGGGNSPPKGEEEQKGVTEGGTAKGTGTSKPGTTAKQPAGPKIEPELSPEAKDRQKAREEEAGVEAETVAKKARAEADAESKALAALREMGLSEDEKTCVLACFKAGLNGPLMLDFGSPENWYASGVLNHTATVQRVIDADEMLVSKGMVRVKGVSTKGLAAGSIVKLDGLFCVKEIKTYATGTGEKVKVPTIALMDRSKVEAALDSEAVRKWAAARADYQRAKAESAANDRRRAEEARQDRAEAARKDEERRAKAEEVRRANAEAERKAEAKRQEYERDGLVLHRDTLNGQGNDFSITITGTVENRSGRKLKYAQITFNLYDEEGAQVGTALANINNLEPGGTWKFKAVGFARCKSYKVSELSGF